MNNSQSFSKAYVWTGKGYRVYVPFRGNWTIEKNTKVMEQLWEYCREHKIPSIAQLGIVKRVNIGIPARDGLSVYSESAASGRTKVYVCNVFK